MIAVFSVAWAADRARACSANRPSKATDLEHRVSDRVTAASHGQDTSSQLTQVAGLDDEVVGAPVEGTNTVTFERRPTQNDDVGRRT